MDKITLAGAWESFEKAMIPDEALPAQRNAMRLAFYSAALFTISAVLTTLDMPDDEGRLLFNLIVRETLDFKNEMRDLAEKEQ